MRDQTERDAELAKPARTPRPVTTNLGAANRAQGAQLVKGCTSAPLTAAAAKACSSTNQPNIKRISISMANSGGATIST